MVIIVLALIGLACGSFVNALVWRLHVQENPKKTKQNLSIAKGRSICTECEHRLDAKDLIPVISWLSLRGKCRYCKKPIHWQYPVVEVSTMVLFLFSYFFWPVEIEGWGVGAFGLWLAILTGLVALVVYDIRWMLLPNKIIFPLYGLAAGFVIGQALAEDSWLVISQAAIGVLVGGGIFYAIFQISKGKWIGGGDVKLGFLLGALAGTGFGAMLMLFFASVLGTIFAVPMLLKKKATRTTRIPFGPFLILATIIVVLFGAEILDWYSDIIIYR